jgi:hypothetical protein
MDPRIITAVVVGLVLMAFGGFYFALVPHNDAVLLPVKTAAPAAVVIPPVASAPVVPTTPAAMTPPPMATPASIEAEFATSEQAELLALLKKNFAFEYRDLLAMAARRRNEGVSDQAFGQELAEGFQTIMRGQLKFGAGASLATIDKLAANEASLFHALGTEGAAFCLKMLGKDDTPAAEPPPDSVRRMMQLGTFYRFQAIAEGLQNNKPLDPLKQDEMKAFEASLAREGLNYKDVSTGAYLNKAGEAGKPCLTLETLHLAIARLADGTRRKIYAGMFFLGRDK